MGRRSERLSKQGMLASDLAGEGDVIQVVSRAFDVLRCFEGHDSRLGNLEISNRCGLPRSTVSRLTHTLTRMGQLVYLLREGYELDTAGTVLKTGRGKDIFNQSLTHTGSTTINGGVVQLQGPSTMNASLVMVELLRMPARASRADRLRRRVAG